jgi:fructose-specific phosphotransferase system IIC component
MGMVYWIKWERLGRILAVSFIVLANVGFFAALSILLSTSPQYPVYYDYLHGVRNILFMPYLTVTITGMYYLLRAKSEMSSKEIPSQLS